MAKKPIFVTLDEELHARMKSAAPLRGMNLQEAYESAVRSWLATEGNITTNDVDDRNQNNVNSHGIGILDSELPWVKGLLSVMRGRNSDAKMAARFGRC